eukprot:7391436-Prymnesium_polylepis.1
MTADIAADGVPLATVAHTQDLAAYTKLHNNRHRTLLSVHEASKRTTPGADGQPKYFDVHELEASYDLSLRQHWWLKVD